MWLDRPTVKAARIRNTRRESPRICSLWSLVLGLNGLNSFVDIVLILVSQSANLRLCVQLILSRVAWHVVLPGTPEHRNITEHSGTPEKPGTPPKNPEHSQENQEHPKKTRNTPEKARNTPRKSGTPRKKSRWRTNMLPLA